MKQLLVWVIMTVMLLSEKQVLAVPLADTTGTVDRFMRQVQQAYRSANYLSFHVLYRYANKSQPGNYIDTLSGEVAMNRNHLRYLMEEVETITNDRYTIQVNKAEK